MEQAGTVVVAVNGIIVIIVTCAGAIVCRAAQDLSKGPKRRSP
jgi:hypothetical protein